MKAVVILSGGQDSTTCLYWALMKYEEVTAVTFDYGQRHGVEVDAAKDIARIAGVPWRFVSLGHILGGTSPLVDRSRQVGTYASADKLPGGIEDTFVPGRNILFLTLAAAMASTEREGDEDVVLVTGVCEEDFGGYPDCRSGFIEAMGRALAEGLGHGVIIATPLMHKTKAETVQLALDLEGCYDALAHSHTCYQGQTPPCGKCHACLLRAKGFAEAGVADPLLERFA